MAHTPPPYPMLPVGKVDPQTPGKKGRWGRRARRVLVGLSLAIGLGSLLLVGLAYVFRDDIQRVVVAQISQRINADVQIRGGVDLSFLRSFPMVSVDLNDVSVYLTEAAALEIEAPNRRILDAERLSFKLNLLSFFTNHYKIRRIELVRPVLFVYRSPAGVWNWQMPLRPFESSDPKAAPPDTAAVQFDLDLLRLEEAQIVCDDRPAGLYAAASNLDLRFAGRFGDERFRLEVDADADVQEVRQRKLTYLRHKPVSIRTALDVDNQKGSYSFAPSYAQVADLRLHLSGRLQDKPKGLDVDVAFASGEVDFQYLLTLLPGILRPDLDDLEAEGRFRVDGTLRGLASAQTSPAIAVEFWVANAGAAVVPDLPRLSGLTARGKLTYNPDQPEKAQLRLDTLHGKLGKLPFTASVRYANFKDPSIDCRLRADVDLKVLQNLVPQWTANLQMAGRIQTDLTAKGRLQDFIKRNFTATYAAGQLVWTNVSIKGATLPQPLDKLNGKLRFTPGAMVVDALSGQAGTTAFTASGKAMDYVPYLFGGQAQLVCLLQISSPYVDFNPWLAAAETAAPATTPNFAQAAQQQIVKQNKPKSGGKASAAQKAKQQATDNADSYAPPSILRSIRAQMQVNIKGFKVFGVEGTDFSGTMDWQPGNLRLQDVRLRAFGGLAELQAAVKQRALSASVTVKQMDVHAAMQAMPQVSDMVVIGPNIHGKVDFGCKLSASLDAGYRLLPATLTGLGTVSVTDGKLLDFKPMARTALFIKLHQYQNLLFSKLTASFAVRDSRLYIDQMEAAANGLILSAQGSHGFDNTLDYHVRFVLPNLKLIKDPPDATAGWVEETTTAKTLSILVHITGTVDNPVFKLDKAAVKEQIKEKLQEEKKEIEATVAQETELIFGKQDTTQVNDLVDETETGPDHPAVIDKAKNWIKDKFKPKKKPKPQ